MLETVTVQVGFPHPGHTNEKERKQINIVFTTNDLKDVVAYVVMPDVTRRNYRHQPHYAAEF